jgi:hypothetical protein
VTSSTGITGMPKFYKISVPPVEYKITFWECFYYGSRPSLKIQKLMQIECFSCVHYVVIIIKVK